MSRLARLLALLATLAAVGCKAQPQEPTPPKMGALGGGLQNVQEQRAPNYEMQTAGLAAILGSNAGGAFDMTGGATVPNLWNTGVSASVQGHRDGGTAELRYNGDWLDSVTELSSCNGGTCATKPSGPTVISIMASAGLNLNNLGMDRIAARLDDSRRGDIIIRNDVPTYAETVSIENYLLAKYAIVPALAKRTIVFTGDSITFGQGLTQGTNDYPTVTISLLNTPSAWKSSDYWSYNVGVTGQTAANLVTVDRVNVDRKLTQYRATNIVVLWAGSNDLYGGAAATTTQANILAAYNAQSAAMPRGGVVIVGTILPRSNGGTPGTFNADRATVNAWIRTTSPRVADFASSATMGVDGASDNVTYYQDKVHPTAAGAAILAQVAATTINAAAP